jgi:hypothetical protein
MRALRLIPLIVLTLLLQFPQTFASSTATHSSSSGMVDADVHRSNRDIQVPKTLVKELEKWYAFEERRRDPQRAGTDLELIGALKRQLLNVKTVFEPKSGDALPHGLNFRLPTGGGLIDMGEHVTGERGGFWMRLDIQNPQVSMIGPRLFYLSGARRRTVRGDDVGMGCGKWAELSGWFGRKGRKQGLDVYAPDQRYVSVLAGTWLVAAVTAGELHLGTVTFTDKRFPHLLCESRDEETARRRPPEIDLLSRWFIVSQ